MSFEIYPSDFSTRYELRHAISTIMTIYYNDIGKLVLVAPVNDYNITALKIGNLLYDTDRDVTFIIANTKIETDTNRITANGYTANWILNKRCIASKYTLTNLESGVYGIEIGRSDSNIKARFTNDKLSFMQSGVEVAYISKNNLYITRAEITDYLKIGNFFQLL